MAEPKDELRKTEYDGITEYDNDLPRWWVWLFVATIVFSILYIPYKHFMTGTSTQEELAAGLAEIEARRAQHRASVSATGGVDDLAEYVQVAAHREAGAVIYRDKCAVCHGPEGQGLIGPNLTDTHWIHGGKPEQIKGIIENGVLEKGMLAWRGVLKDDEIRNVTAFVISLKGTNPPNPKAPEGDPEA